jgi:hypothetical protein
VDLIHIPTIELLKLMQNFVQKSLTAKLIAHLELKIIQEISKMIKIFAMKKIRK